MARPLPDLLAETELVNSIRKLVPEERRTQMFEELGKMEKERRGRVALEESEKDNEEKYIERLKNLMENAEGEKRKQEAKKGGEKKRKQGDKKREEENRREEALQETNELQEETVEWEQVIILEEESTVSLQYTISQVKKAQQRQCKFNLKHQTFVKMIQWQGRRKPLINNWVQQCDSPLSPTKSSVVLHLSQEKPKSRLSLTEWQDEVEELKEVEEEEELEEVEKNADIYRLPEAYKQRRCLSHLSEQISVYSMSRNHILRSSLH